MVHPLVYLMAYPMVYLKVSTQVCMFFVFFFVLTLAWLMANAVPNGSAVPSSLVQRFRSSLAHSFSPGFASPSCCLRH